MRCPADVRREDFEDLKRSIPDGAKFLKSRRVRWWRVFRFLLTKPVAGRLKQGDHFEISLVCKFNK